MAESAASVAVQLAELRKQLGGLQDVVNRLSVQDGSHDHPLLRKEIDALTELLHGHIDAEEERATSQSAPRWDGLGHDDYQKQLGRVGEFVNEHLRVAYADYWRDVLQDCWPYHQAALWELGNLWAEWNRTYDQKHPSLTGALNWHDRWMPGAAARLRPVMRGCPAWAVHRTSAGAAVSPRGAAEEAAHGYADAGWPAFPVVPGQKAPVTANGFKDATTDHGQIERWWSRNPERNVAIATGAPGPDVVDVDNHGQRGNGFGAWNQAKREGLVSDPAAIVRTPSGGMHAYFRGTDQRSAKIPARHVDFRAQGGYVVAPPSAVAGRRYEVVQHKPSGATVDFGAVRRLLEPERQAPRRAEPAAGRPRDVGHLAGWVATLGEGNRNDGLFWAANRAVEAGDSATLAAIAKAARETGLAEREIDRTIRSAQRGPGRPAEREAG